MVFRRLAICCQAYPKISSSIPKQSKYGNPDAIMGGTWEAFERVLQKHGYYKQGLSKVEIAGQLGKCMDPERNSSRSFASLRDAIADVI